MSECAARTSRCDKETNWMLEHPVYEAMRSLGAEDDGQLHAAFLVYMDLTQVRQWKDVSCVKTPELQAVLLEGKEKEGAPVQTVLPLPAHRAVSHRSVRCVLDRGPPVLLCAAASDSTLVYQRMTDGLVTPDPPAGPFQDVGRRQHRKRRQQH
ncbi:tRNA-splicing endonuclease subunit Sen15 [Thalassophryne amazonica]|uniref:tRNA-splicing endonuclease subunit Sen15 n=1 Tax=Thalassophryne amazonica TaxID=390379 RepID=UPI00147186E9|nr:tRNA-splicing endonuclease subunit Sen15 [Thalassophryne amazonica]